MIIFPFCSIAMLLSFHKDFFFFSSLFFLDSSILLLVFIFPMVVYLIFTPFFNFSNFKENLIYKFLVLPVIFFLFFCFSSLNSFYFLIFVENCVIFMVRFIILYSKDLDKISSSFFMFFINIFPSILFMYFCFE